MVKTPVAGFRFGSDAGIANAIMSGVFISMLGWLFASVIAWPNESTPLGSVFLTVKVSARAVPMEQRAIR